MLNVAFTRAREEIHIFHSAPIGEFGMASGRGTILEWLNYCNRATAGMVANAAAEAQCEFEAGVIQALNAQGVKTSAQYAACGFNIDVMAELGDQRLAIECDG